MLPRTAKSCGPDASTPASSQRRFGRPNRVGQNRKSADDGDKQARSPGRARYKPLKPLRAGMPGCPGGPVVTTLVCFFICTRGCGCIARPAFPTPSLGRKFHLQLGRIASREGEGVSAIGAAYSTLRVVPANAGTHKHRDLRLGKSRRTASQPKRHGVWWRSQ